MSQDELVEFRNKAIQFYQLAVMMDSGGADVKHCIETLKKNSKSMINSLDKVINENSLKGQIINGEYESLFEPIEVNEETLLQIRGYLEKALKDSKNIIKI